MSSITAVVIIGIGLVLTLLIGIASQRYGRASDPAPAPHNPTREQQEDLEAINQRIEEARSELLWLREQVTRERTRLEGLRRQTPGSGPVPAAAGSTQDNPWVVLGLRPGSSPEDIRRRYRLLSRVWHPDRFVEGPAELRAEAEIMMARLNRAHNALTGQVSIPRR